MVDMCIVVYLVDLLFIDCWLLCVFILILIVDDDLVMLFEVVCWVLLVYNVQLW